MTTKWTTKSRYNDLREFEWDRSTCLLTVTCHNTLYYSMSGSLAYLQAIDPDGGPYLGIGYLLEAPGVVRRLRLKQVVSHSHNDFSKVLVIVLNALEEEEVKEVNANDKQEKKEHIE